MFLRHILIFIFEKIFLKIKKIITTFLIFKKIFLKIKNLMRALPIIERSENGIVDFH